MTDVTGIQFSAIQRYQSVENVHFSTTLATAESDGKQIHEDQVNISYSTETSGTYNSALVLSAADDGGIQFLRNVLIDVFEQQGISTRIATEDGELDISTLDQESARELIAEDGYFGVEKTSERIFQLAVGIAGGDPSRLATIKQGVEQGFQEALEAFGGWLPDISHDTYDAVMNKLDDWAENGEVIQT